MKGFVKDPQAILDYTINWAPWLNGDTISTSAWTVDSPATSVSESKTTGTTTIFVSGGVAGSNYVLINSIVTAGGREDERSIELRVRDR